MGNRKYAYYFCVDKNLCISSWGKEVAHYVGLDATEALKKKYYEVFPRLWVNGKDALEESLRTNKSSALADHFLTCPHARSRSDISIKPLRDVLGNAVGVRVSVRADMSCPVLDAFEASRQFVEIGKQATIFAHRIRNPLNAIKGAVVYLREKYEADTLLREFTDIMTDEIAKLDASISKFLTATLTDMEMAETDVNLILKKVEIITSLQANARNIKTAYSYGKVPPVKIDGFQFEQAILNVINNAMEAMPHGGSLKVKSATARRMGRRWALLEVSDSGGGLIRRRKSAAAETSTREGRGFGLLVTREVLQAFKGEIEIKSKKGMGTTVRMFLPAV